MICGLNGDRQRPLDGKKEGSVVRREKGKSLKRVMRGKWEVIRIERPGGEGMAEF